MKTKKVLYIVPNIFSHHIAHTFLSQTFDFHHFTTHIYPSHYTPLSPLPYAALHCTSLHFTHKSKYPERVSIVIICRLVDQVFRIQLPTESRFVYSIYSSQNFSDVQ